MAKQFLDATGLLYLWNKIKSTFLPLSGGNIPGTIYYTNSHGTNYFSIGTNGNVEANEGTGWIASGRPGGINTIIEGGYIQLNGSTRMVISYSDIKIDNVSIIDEALTKEEINAILV